MFDSRAVGFIFRCTVYVNIKEIIVVLCFAETCICKFNFNIVCFSRSKSHSLAHSLIDQVLGKYQYSTSPLNHGTIAHTGVHQLGRYQLYEKQMARQHPGQIHQLINSIQVMAIHNNTMLDHQPVSHSCHMQLQGSLRLQHKIILPANSTLENSSLTETGTGLPQLPNQICHRHQHGRANRNPNNNRHSRKGASGRFQLNGIPQVHKKQTARKHLVVKQQWNLLVLTHHCKTSLPQVQKSRTRAKKKNNKI